jgi:hypothetical protein
MAGKITVLTPERSAEILANLAVCISDSEAILMSGVRRGTFDGWMNKGRKQESGPFREFYNGAMKARVARKRSLLVNVRLASQKDWRAAAWMLSKIDPAYSESARLTIALETQRQQDFEAMANVLARHVPEPILEAIDAEFNHMRNSAAYLEPEPENAGP